MSRRPSRYDGGPSRRIDQMEPGFFKVRLCKGGPFLPAVIRVENSTDDEGRVADRPRLVLHLDGKSYQRGEIVRWWPSLRPIAEAEYRRLVGVPVVPPSDQRLDLNLLQPLFGSTANG